jgi:hypothetical protein
MRDLTPTDKNIMRIYDVASGTPCDIYYRTPTTQDRVAYNSAIANQVLQAKDLKEPGKIKEAMAAMMDIQIKEAAKLITAIGEDCFGVDGKPISSDPDNKNYYDKWREILMDSASDIILTFAKTLLGEPNFVVKPDFLSSKSSDNSHANGRRNSKKNI